MLNISGLVHVRAAGSVTALLNYLAETADTPEARTLLYWAPEGKP